MVQFGIQVPASPVGPAVVLWSGEDVLSVVGVDDGETATGIDQSQNTKVGDRQIPTYSKDATGSNIRRQLGTLHLEVAPVRVWSVVVSVRGVRQCMVN